MPGRPGIDRGRALGAAARRRVATAVAGGSGSARPEHPEQGDPVPRLRPVRRLLGDRRRRAAGVEDAGEIGERRQEGHLALGDAQPFRSVPGACYEVKVDYSEFDRITRQIREKGWTVESSVFDSGVAINVLVPDSDCQVFKDFCRDATSGRAIVGKLGIREIEGEKLNLF